MAGHRAALLRHAELIDRGEMVAFDMRAHGQHGADGHDAGAADAGDQHAIGLGRLKGRPVRFRDRGQQLARRGFQPLRLPAHDADEAGAKPFDAGIVLVAGRLVDLPLAPEGRIQRRHRQAVGFGVAVAASLADQVVDQHPARRIDHLAALAPPAFLCRAGLVVDHDGHAADRAQFLLHPVQRLPVLDLRARRQAAMGRVLLRLVAHDDDFLHALRMHLQGDRLRRQRAVQRLATGHGDRVVEQDLEGDVALRRDAGADRQQAGMVIGAVAHILEDMVGFHEGFLADPVQTLAAHMAVGHVVAVHIGRHVVAADAAHGAAALRHPGRGVVRTAGTEIGQAVDAKRLARVIRLGARFEEFDPRRGLVASMEMRDTLGQRAGDVVRRVFRKDRQDGLAALVVAADDLGPPPIGQPVQRALQLAFGKLVFFLDDQHFLQPVGEAAEQFVVGGVGHADLEHRDSQVRCLRPVDAELAQRLADIGPGLAGGDDAVARLVAAVGHPVDLVGATEADRGGDLVAFDPFLVFLPRIRESQPQPARGDIHIVRRDDRQALRIAQDRRCRVDRVGDQLVADPASGEARHRPAIERVVDDLLYVGGIEHGHPHVGEQGLVRRGRVGRGQWMIVADDAEHAAMLRRAGAMGVADRVDAAVDAWALAVPHRIDAVIFRIAEDTDLLRPPDRRRRQIFVHGGQEADIGTGQEPLGGPQLLVQIVHRRAAIAGDEAGGLQSRRLVAQMLLHRRAHQRLRAGDVHLPVHQLVFIVERNRSHRTRTPNLWSGQMVTGQAAIS